MAATSADTSTPGMIDTIVGLDEDAAGLKQKILGLAGRRWRPQRREARLP
jgi:hypothetical protein